jgi:hypothetical protein
MKLFYLFCMISIGAISCSTDPNAAAKQTDSATVKEALIFPFTAKYSSNWQPGDEKNAVIVLNSLKKDMDGDLVGAFENFADSVEFNGDRFHFYGKKDSLRAMLTAFHAQLASVSIEPDSWMTTYYPDQKDTWVTVWYKEKWTNKMGKSDSTYDVDDVLVKDGKILLINDAIRNYPEQMAKK